MTSADRLCDYGVEFEGARLDRWVKRGHKLQLARRRCSDFETFRDLVHAWRNETWYKSSIARRISHPAYLQIIGLGSKAVPWILQELRQEPDYWFAALEAITRDNPSPNATTMRDLRDAWLAWGEERGY